MFVIIGWVVVMGSIFGGYAMAGGHLGGLWQPLEVVMIAGGAFGAFIAANSMPAIKHTLSSMAACFKGSKYTKTYYLELTGMLYELLAKARKEGLMALEIDVEEPEKSTIFAKYPSLTANPHLMDFITDYLRMMVSGNLNAMEIEALMDSEIEIHHHEQMHPSHAIQKLADATPAFGIVAAVMGVVHTMESLHLPPSELGVLIGHALVGTFLGILISYGFFAPLSTLMESRAGEAAKPFHVVKAVLLASMNGYAPQTCVEFGRKVLFSGDRPSFKEMEEDIKGRKAK
ncbi:MAG TPA: flagellar motor stator protein MotA [Thiobacillaceae bacterium]|nr:flagellar motor stator protein MotA [Thiobacillaceae bacterium]HNU63479.1 flagellar motor stator protein MotA [Thiobacillaceae bacterium]